MRRPCVVLMRVLRLRTWCVLRAARNEHKRSRNARATTETQELDASTSIASTQGVISLSCMSEPIPEPRISIFFSIQKSMLDIREICKHWQRFRGYCMFGEKCRFSHPAELVDSSVANHIPPSSDVGVAESRRQAFPKLKEENDQKRKKATTHKINNKLLNRNKEGAFRRWLLDIKKLQSGSGIIDVAGGKGALSFELSNLNGVNCTVIDPRPLNLKHYKRRLKVGLYHRTEVLQCYNNKPAPKEEKDIVLPNHLRIFLDQPLLDVLNQNIPQDSEQQNISPGEEFFNEAIEKGRAVCWSKKGLKDTEEVDDKWKYDTQPGAVGTGMEHVENVSDDEVVANDVLTQDDFSDSVEITTWGNARKVFTDFSVAIGLHPDQATEAIVDLALERKKPFAVIPCCVYHKEFPKRRFPDGTPISKYEDFIDYLIAKDPTNIHKTVLDIEGKNTILYYHPRT